MAEKLPAESEGDGGPWYAGKLQLRELCEEDELCDDDRTARVRVHVCLSVCESESESESTRAHLQSFLHAVKCSATIHASVLDITHVRAYIPRLSSASSSPPTSPAPLPVAGLLPGEPSGRVRGLGRSASSVLRDMSAAFVCAREH